MSSKLSMVEQLAYSTVRVVADGDKVGTGFLMRFRETDTQYIPVLITNGHVLEGAKELQFQFSLADGDKPSRDVYQVRYKVGPMSTRFLSGYRSGSDRDVCALLLAPVIKAAEGEGRSLFYRTLGVDMLASDADLEELMQLEPVTMIGYPIGLMDNENNQPIFRQGVLATSPYLDYNGRKEFLTDISTIGGSSGSPVFVMREGFTHNRRTGAIRVGGGSECKLIGIHRGGFRHDAQGRIVEIVPEEIRSTSYAALTQFPINLGIVIKPNRIRELESMF